MSPSAPTAHYRIILLAELLRHQQRPSDARLTQTTGETCILCRTCPAHKAQRMLCETNLPLTVIAPSSVQHPHQLTPSPSLPPAVPGKLPRTISKARCPWRPRFEGGIRGISLTALSFRSPSGVSKASKFRRGPIPLSAAGIHIPVVELSVGHSDRDGAR